MTGTGLVAIYSGICSFGSNWVKDSPNKTIECEREFAKGKDAKQMKITQSATRKTKGISEMHGSLLLNDLDEYSEAK